MKQRTYDHLEHLGETTDLFGNLARSFAASEKLVKDETEPFFLKCRFEMARGSILLTSLVEPCGQAMASSKREANGKVVEMVLKPVQRAPETMIFLIGSFGSRSDHQYRKSLILLVAGAGFEPATFGL